MIFDLRFNGRCKITCLIQYMILLKDLEKHATSKTIQWPINLRTILKLSFYKMVYIHSRSSLPLHLAL